MSYHSLIDVDFGTFKEVSETYTIPFAIKQYVNEKRVNQELLEKELNIPVAQITAQDFIDISFPNASGYFCFFKKGETKKAKTIKATSFLTKKEVKEKLDYVLDYGFGLNTYISYSTYYDRVRKYIKVPKRIKLADGTFSKACDLETKKEYYITENVKKMKPRRTQKNIVYTFLLAQDLDYYKEGLTDRLAVRKISKLIKDGKIICPTFFLFTGRGIQLVWAVKPFKNIKNYTHDKEWRSIQNEMIGIFDDAGLHPDSVVKNPSAVTRTVGTYNKSAKDIVRAYYANAARLTLDDFIFHHGLFPQPDKKVAPKKSHKPAVIIPFPIEKAREILEEVKREWREHYHINDKVLSKMKWNVRTLNEARVEDFFTYIEIFKERGRPLEAKRNWLAMVVAFHTLAATEGDSESAYHNVLRLWDSLPDQNETDLEEVMRRGYEAAVKHYNDWVNDTWDKKAYVRGGLFYNNARLMEIMGITKDYDIQLKMKTIKIRNKEYEAYKKRVERHGNEAHEHTREAYLEKQKEITNDKLWQLEQAIKRHPQIKNVELAEELSISVPYVKKLKRKLKERA